MEGLLAAGLTRQESAVYTALLKYGASSAHDLSRRTAIDRTLVYSLLNHLVDRGLANYVVREGRKVFSPADPENLLNHLREREAVVRKTIPELKTLQRIAEVPSDVTVYEGKNGIRVFVNLALKQKSLLVFGSTGKAFTALHEMPRLAKEALDARIPVRAIMAKGCEDVGFAKFRNIRVRHSDVESEATTCVFGDYVSIHWAEPLYRVIIVKNRLVAESYRNHFEVLWKATSRRPRGRRER